MLVCQLFFNDDCKHIITTASLARAKGIEPSYCCHISDRFAKRQPSYSVLVLPKGFEPLNLLLRKQLLYPVELRKCILVGRCGLEPLPVTARFYRPFVRTPDFTFPLFLALVIGIAPTFF